MFAVVVTLTVNPERIVEFMPLMLENAAASLTEPGCHQFDVCTDKKRNGEVLLYEIYDDPAAFQDHLKTPHFLSFDAATADLIMAKDVRTYESVQQ